MGTFLRWVGFLVVLALLVIFVLRLLFPLPSRDGFVQSVAIPADGSTTLGAFALEAGAEHPGLTGVYPLASGFDAYAARAALARGAERSIDARYYIWSDDVTGLTLLKELQDAAERGVRVRLLVDDNGTPALDPELAALDALENAEVRIFNPFTLRNPRVLSYMFDFFRLNRRMHNKSFTVDGAATIVGGRNIGDVYFETGDEGIYFDLDVLAVGPAAQDVADDFDRYWQSQSAYPAHTLIETSKADAGRLSARAQEAFASDQFEGYRRAVEQSVVDLNPASGALPLEWVSYKLYSDDPAKGLGPVPEDQLLISTLWSEMPPPEESFDLISAYFIPGQKGTEILSDYAKRGIAVRTLTNSLDATDVAMVHGGYIRYRDALVDSGVGVYELRSGIEERKTVDKFGILGQSTSSLHAKSFAYDRRHIFIGSFNFDPRSAELNCEMGFLFDSPQLASRMQEQFDTVLPYAAYRVVRGDEGGLIWQEKHRDGAVAEYESEPETSWGERLVVHLVSWLPIEWML